MDSETALLYGGDNLEFWNPVSNSPIGEWSGKSKGINIGQVQPLSSSILAIVSSDAGENGQASKAGRLSFMNASWSAEDSRFADMPVRQWTSDAPTEDISVVEGIDSEDIGDDSQVSIFTGNTSGGGVYRRIFDVSESVVTNVNQVSMINNHHGIVSALCHIQAQGRLVSGSTTGTICLIDHDSGKIVEEFNLEIGNVISSITRCPINPHLFMVGCSQPKYKLHIFDIREKLMGKRPSLTLQDAGSMATSRNNHPSWDYNTGLIVAPVRKVIFNKPTAVINTWDPRFIKCSKAETLWIHLDESKVFSVAFTKPANAEDRLIITASEDTCFSWALDKLLPEDTVGVISYILPVILGLLGDYDTREKTRGVNLAIILIGKCNDEFGHLIANAADSVPIDQLKALQSKMSSSSHLARAVALTTVGKIINLFPEIKTLCLRVLDRYRGALDAELQQRACEYYALGTLEGDELLPTVFEEMPPFPERQSALMSRLLKREADTEDQRTWVVGSHENNCKHRGGMSGTASNDSREAVEASAMPVSIASQASNPAGGSTAAPRADAPAASSTPQLTMDPSVAKSMRNYARLLWENDDILFDGEEIQVGVMAQYKPPGGRLGVFLGNRATAPLYSIFITARTADGTQLDIQPAAGQEAKQIPESLMPLAQARVFFDVQCKQVFGAALTLHIGYTVAGSAPTVSELQLPVTVGHFMDPVTISVADFFARWKQLGDSGIAESQHVLPSAFLTKDAAGLEWLRSVVGGMGFALIQGADPEPNNIVGVGIATTQAGRFGCLVRVEPKPAHGLTRVTLRATNAEVARSIGSNIKMVFESK
ncbi:hypothetical protein GGI15_004480 [Coemansia interrupta]|uniref:Clathrin adaptor alpha-adaptin appendage C-terminal subdomain domain-containing protein n=1 Tax=Coemansia interrupta TaxID=1126814 RepID=A0A9W8LEU1_9FUNG|nr:hypothetical protein GGI15_004480 [Coemansia interrupta]